MPNRLRLNLYFGLLAKWAVAFACMFLLVAGLFTLFLGRDWLVRNQSIYEGLLYVNQPGTKSVAGMQGYGVTSYGEDGLVVNKILQDNVIRIVFWGDSFVEARQVSDQHKFTEIVEQSWNKRHPEMRIQSLNLGLAGLDSRAYLQFGENVDATFKPDYLFLMITNPDFYTLSYRPVALERVAAGDYTNLVRSESDFGIRHIVNDIGLQSFASQLKLQTFAFMNEGNQRVSETVNAKGKESRSAELQESIQLQLQALKSIWGNRLVILYRQQVTDYGRNLEEGKTTELYKALAASDIPYIDTYEPLQIAMRDGKPPYGFINFALGKGHLNQVGHQLVADAVLGYLEGLEALE
ncbi:MAG: hypothetical protein AAF702_45130 [Chloroflexota bacterium]